MTNESQRIDLLERIAESFLEQLRLGDQPSIVEYEQRHPQLAEEIRELLPTLAAMEDAGQNVEPVAGPHQGIVSPDGRTLTQLGEYKLLREIGRGGMGIVFEAEQTSLGRRVALKVLPQRSLMDDSQLQRFQLEAKAAAGLQHPHIVPIHGVGQSDGIDYFTMQYIEGPNLEQVRAEVRALRDHSSSRETQRADNQSRWAASVASVLLEKRTPRRQDDGLVARQSRPETELKSRAARDETAVRAGSTVSQAQPSSDSWITSGSSVMSSGKPYYRNVARIGVQAADALEYAHANGILHRDIKPSNLLLDLEGNAWITDFGLAKFQQGDDITDSGTLVGTLRYMAPERFDGWADRRSDVYSLGLTIYELLSLGPAFSQTDRQHLIRAILENEPTPPRRLDPLIPADLETITLKSIAKEPTQRYRSAEELASDLRCFLEGKPIRARRTSAREKAWLWCRRNPLSALLAATAFVFLVAALAATSIGWWSTVTALQRENVARRDAQRRYQQTKDAVEEYYTKVSENKLMATPGQKPLRRELLTSALKYYEQLAAETDDDDLRFEMEQTYFRIGQIRAEFGEKGQALSAYRQSLALIDEQLKDEPSSTALQLREGRTLAEIGTIQADTLGPQEGLGTMESGIECLESVLEADAENNECRAELAKALNRKGIILRTLGRSAEAAEAFEAAVTLRKHLVKSDPTNLEYQFELGSCEGNLANVIRRTGRLDESQKLSETVTQRFRELAKQDPAALHFQVALAKSLGNLALLQQQRRHPRLAEELLREAIPIYDRLVLIHPQVVEYRVIRTRLHGDLGTQLIELSRFDEAENVLRHAALMSQQFLTEHAEVASFRQELAARRLSLGTFLADRNRPDEAIVELEAALIEFTELTRRAPDDFQSQLGRGLCHYGLGRAHDQLEDGRALRHLDMAVQSLTDLQQNLPGNRLLSDNLSTALIGRAKCKDRLARFDEARADWQAAVQYGSGTNRISAQIGLAAAHAWSGQCQTALTMIGEADSSINGSQLNRRGDLFNGMALSYLRIVECLQLQVQPTGETQLQPLKDQAIRALSIARELGYFSDSDRVDSLRSSPGYDPLRDREDFQQLLQQLDASL